MLYKGEEFIGRVSALREDLDKGFNLYMPSLYYEIIADDEYMMEELLGHEETEHESMKQGMDASSAHKKAEEKELELTAKRENIDVASIHLSHLDYKTEFIRWYLGNSMSNRKTWVNEFKRKNRKYNDSRAERELTELIEKIKLSREKLKLDSILNLPKPEQLELESPELEAMSSV